MRQNVIVALLAVCCTLLAVNVVLQVSTPPALVFGQAVGNPEGGFVLATGQTQSGSKAVLYVLETATKKLSAYSVENRGIEFKGVREITNDLKPIELKPNRPLSPSEVEKAWEEATKSGGGK
jgi:hypothetical protein